ncbi:hypothetical protein DLAC_09873 [Tieghemostelium lacteum]|uniref:Uncharacterized protein n=1 Tax=Tieghemostelium lacteum TaxID=361077 RepID=A0A151Z5I3_TIELA|nr:hypothetical protein DLAC_09873 [Tieghemostelium lacteum]|eukprot:KYQ89222.1 hypothetical protein DLAC_09873 [Tieghemostelium lacteum]
MLDTESLFSTTHHSISVHSLENVKAAVDLFSKKENNDNFIIYHFEVNDTFINDLLKLTPESITRIKEQYIDDENYSLLQQNIWVKYQNGILNANITKNVAQNGGCIDISKCEDSQKNKIKEYFQDNGESAYATYLMKRYKFKQENGLIFYVDCVFYTEIERYALFGNC